MCVVLGDDVAARPAPLVGLCGGQRGTTARKLSPVAVGALATRHTDNARFVDRRNTLPQVSPECRTTHAKNLRPLGFSVAGFSTHHTRLAFLSFQAQTPWLPVNY